MIALIPYGASKLQGAAITLNGVLCYVMLCYDQRPRAYLYVGHLQKQRLIKSKHRLRMLQLGSPICMVPKETILDTSSHDNQ